MEYSWIYILSILGLILLSAFFSGAEIALLTVSRVKLNSLVEDGSAKASRVLSLKNDPNRLITGVLIGNNIVNILATSLATSYATKLLKNGETAVIVSTVVLTVLIVIFAEMFPKTVSNSNPLKISMLVYFPVVFSMTMFAPLIWFFSLINKMLLKMFNIKDSQTSLVMKQRELETVINMSQRDGTIQQEEREMLKSVFDFKDTHVNEIMVPRVDMECLDIEDGIEEFFNIVKKTGYSRIPVFEEKPDNIIGILFVKDVIRWISSKKPLLELNIKSGIRPAEFVPETKKIDQLFKEMREKKNHIVMVVDEYGGISGLLTLEDILEEIVGEIQDEFDSEEELSRQLKDGSYEIVGDYPIDDFNESFTTDISEEDAETISGFMLAELGHIPDIGEIVKYRNLELTVRDMEDRRITKVSVKISTPLKETSNDAIKKENSK
ncbi:MAG: HlyC/CorC family transporter [Caldisericia bacterium]|nr:HlyC/CorC family transporter [Caldisericia bacterium]